MERCSLLCGRCHSCRYEYGSPPSKTNMIRPTCPFPMPTCSSERSSVFPCSAAIPLSPAEGDKSLSISPQLTHPLIHTPSSPTDPHLRTHSYTHTHTHTPTYAHTCARTYTCKHTLAHMHIRTHAHMHTCIHACTHGQADTHTHMHTHTYAFARIVIHC